MVNQFIDLITDKMKYEYYPLYMVLVDAQNFLFKNRKILSEEEMLVLKGFIEWVRAELVNQYLYKKEFIFDFLTCELVPKHIDQEHEFYMEMKISKPLHDMLLDIKYTVCSDEEFISFFTTAVKDSVQKNFPEIYKKRFLEEIEDFERASVSSVKITFWDE